MKDIRRRVADLLPGRNYAAMITSKVSRKYVTGFGSSAGIVLITRTNDYFFIDARYYEKAVDEVHGYEVILLKDFKKQMSDILTAERINNILIENREMTVAELSEAEEKFPGIKFDGSGKLSDFLEKARLIKSKEEIAKIEKAQRIAEKAFMKLLDKIKPGHTERQIAALLDFYMMDFGSDGSAFETIAASGKHSAIPHASPTEKLLQKGEFLTLDFGASLDGYCSDMTRTVVIGKEAADKEMLRVYNAVLGANSDAMKAIRDDISGKLVDNVARSTLDAWGYEKYFTHGLGHGVGLEVHEQPTLSVKSTSTLREGMVVTVEPGVYIPHSFGVRIEDMVVVTADGCYSLAKTPKALAYI
ncbi:peptidase M24 [Clostridia bacterium]|nr:peptidase M24 [Clostridia bacterium]